MPTLLAKKADSQIPVATDDEHYSAMAADPAIPQIPQGTTFNNLNNLPAMMNSGPQINRTAAASENAASNAEILVKHNKESSDWINKKWRPAMGWMYMTVCIFDFIIFPIMFTIVQFWETQAANDAFRQWEPMTLHGAGLFHMAMGAVIGITSYGRTKEKIEGKA